MFHDETYIKEKRYYSKNKIDNITGSISTNLKNYEGVTEKDI